MQLVRFFLRDARLLQSDADLAVHRVDARQIGQQDASPPAAGDDHSVAARIKLLGLDGTARAQHVDRIRQVAQLAHTDRRKAWVVERGRAGVASDLSTQIGLGRLQGPDAAAQLAACFEGHKAGGSLCEERRSRRRRRALGIDCGFYAGAGEVGRALLDAISAALDLNRQEFAVLTTALAAVFFVISAVFVYRSFYGMRIESK